MSRCEFNRRDFLKLTGASLAAILASKNGHASAYEDSGDSGEWKRNYLEQIIGLNQNPDFWLTPLSRNKTQLYVNQEDGNQYSSYSLRANMLEDFKGNGCVLASLTTVRRWATFLFTGNIPEGIDIVPTYKHLIGETYTQGRHKNVNPIIWQENRPFISYFAYKRALEVLDSETQYYNVIEVAQNLETFVDNGLPTVNALSYGDVQRAYDRARVLITAQGGITMFHVYKYNFGHASVIPYVPEKVNQDALIIDPRGRKNSEVVEEPIYSYTRFVVYALGIVPNLDLWCRENHMR